jgi:hypothetical protein
VPMVYVYYKFIYIDVQTGGPCCAIGLEFGRDQELDSDLQPDCSADRPVTGPRQSTADT